MDRLIIKLKSYPDHTHKLCRQINITPPSTYLEFLEEEHTYNLVAIDLCDHIRDILKCKSADQGFVDMIIDDLDTVKVQLKAKKNCN